MWKLPSIVLFLQYCCCLCDCTENVHILAAQIRPKYGRIWSRICKTGQIPDLPDPEPKSDTSLDKLFVVSLMIMSFKSTILSLFVIFCKMVGFHIIIGHENNYYADAITNLYVVMNIIALALAYRCLSKYRYIFC